MLGIYRPGQASSSLHKAPCSLGCSVKACWRTQPTGSCTSKIQWFFPFLLKMYLLKALPNPPNNWSAKLLSSMCLPNPMSEEVPNQPPDYYTAPFRADKVDRLVIASEAHLWFKWLGFWEEMIRPTSSPELRDLEWCLRFWAQHLLEGRRRERWVLTGWWRKEASVHAIPFMMWVSGFLFNTSLLAKI